MKAGATKAGPTRAGFHLFGTERHLNRTAVLTAIAAVVIGLIAAYILVNGSAKAILFLPGIILVAIGFYYPQVILWLLIGLTVCFDGSEYAVGTESVFRPGAYILDPFRFNISQILILALTVILLARWLLGLRVVRLPKPVWIPAVAVLLVYVFQFARAMTSGVPYIEVINPFNGAYVPFAVVAFWCLVQVLDSPRKRLRMLDILFVFATYRALFALLRYFLGSGDTANAYRAEGVKVALWESADHLLFTFLIVIAVAGWAMRRLDRTRALLWLTGSVFMGLTVLLSFRRMSWIGLGAAIAVTAIAIAPRSRRAAALIPVVLGFAAGIVVFAQQRFSGSGSLVTRVFADLVGNNGPTRQEEWALAWSTIAKNPLAGDIAARRAGSSFAFWDERMVHSGILYSWMKFGLVGLIALAVLPVACGWYALKAVRARVSEEHIAFGMIGLAPFILIYTVIADPLIELRTLLIMAVGGALGLLAWLQRDVANAGTSEE